MFLLMGGVNSTNVSVILQGFHETLQGKRSEAL
jgi:hypothetical protein